MWEKQKTPLLRGSCLNPIPLYFSKLVFHLCFFPKFPTRILQRKLIHDLEMFQERFDKLTRLVQYFLKYLHIYPTLFPFNIIFFKYNEYIINNHYIN